MSDQDHLNAQLYQDPGWLGFAGQAGSGPNGVSLLRLLFLALFGAALLIGVVLTFVIEEMGSIDLPVAAGLLAYGLVGVMGARWAMHRPLDTTDHAGLARSFNANFFIGFALAEAPLLMGFVFCFVQEERWPYFLCLPLYLVGMATIAPTRANLERRQGDLQAQGSDLSLGAALAQAPRSADG